MKKIEELKTIKSDAYDYYVSPEGDNGLFEKIFLVGDVIDEIYEPDKFFLVGEKGSGKTAYSVYISGNKDTTMAASISMVENTLYQKFINMKKQKMLELSGIKDIWIDLLYLILADNLRGLTKKSFFSGRKLKALDQAIRLFYSDAFKPELVNAMEFVENADKSLNVMASNGVFSGDIGVKGTKKAAYTEQTYQISLLKIQKEFEEAFEELDIEKKYILFIDGIDARPIEIDNKDYFECITGLINAVIEINRGILAEKGVKIMPLMRPDVMYRLPIHNLNQKLMNNSVLLNWTTKYSEYVTSKLFSIADGYFEKQQERAYELAECWNHYFPYSISGKKAPDNPFIEFLRYSTYKPRDILTMLNEMVMATSGESFTRNDFNKMVRRYSNYLEGELKDYLLIYMSDDDYNNFRILFDYFQGRKKFDYKFFQAKHLEYVKYLHELGRELPPSMSRPAEALQLMYDANIIGYEERERQGRFHWSYKERSYANMRPNIPPQRTYTFHLAYAVAFGVL